MTESVGSSGSLQEESMLDLDLCFAIDCTGSMGSYINKAREVTNCFFLYMLRLKRILLQEHKNDSRSNYQNGEVYDSTEHDRVQRSSASG